MKLIVNSSSLIVHKIITASAAILLLLTIINYLLPIAHAQSATLSLSPSTGTFNKGCQFNLEVKLSTGGAQTDGTDAIISYDASRFSATSITPNTSTYPDFPGNSIDDTGGKIIISGIASVAGSFSGSGSLATVNMSVKEAAPTGATQIRFDFDPNDRTKTTDSNVVERGTVADILTNVTNGNYTIGEGTCAGAGNTGTGDGTTTIIVQDAIDASGSAGTKIPYKNLDEAVGGMTGSVELTYTLAIVGSVLVILGILGLAIL